MVSTTAWVRARQALAAMVAGVSAGAALAGGTPENILLIIDPTSPVSLHIGNHYRTARNIPDSHVLYMRSATNSYTDFRNIIQAAFLDTLTQRGIGAPIDYVVLAPSDVFFVSAPGLVVDGCFPVGRFSISSCYTLAQVSSTIVAGTPVSAANQFYSTSDNASSFDASQGYVNGIPSGSGAARRYYIGAVLGYTGPFGNTANELRAMIDRSVAADGTRPAGTTYYMNNAADPDRNVRVADFPAAVTAITTRGGSALTLPGVIPTGQSDVAGIMTGAADINFTGANMTLLPGAFCDHLTSWAATFDIGAQTKMTSWIVLGASGTAGTVEEPCNYTGKFPHPRLHVWYRQGMSLGEAYLRSMQFLPFQSLLYGDPMARPWAFLPTCSITNLPASTVSGSVTLTTASAATAPGAFVSQMELMVDGVSRGTIIPSLTNSFTLDTTTLIDGWHDIRVLARDSTATRNMGRWVGSITTSNFGRTAGLGVTPASGDLSQAFTFTPSWGGGTATRVQLLHNGRIIAGTTSPGTPLTVYGSNLGAGASRVVAEVTFGDGRVARSAPVTINVGNTPGTPAAVLPTVFSIRRELTTPTAYVVELPAAFPHGVETAQAFLITAPTQATILNNGSAAPFRIIRPTAGASGSETIQYRVVTPGGQSALGQITLVYTVSPPCPTDFNADGTVNADDLSDFITGFFTRPIPDPRTDFDHNGEINPDDLSDYITAFFGAGC